MGRTATLFLLVALVCGAVLARRLQSVWPEFDSDPPVILELSPASPEFPLLIARGKLKDQVAREVLAGRLSLPEAAEEFRRIQGDRLPEILGHLPGDSTEEKLCRQVIRAVEGIEFAARPDLPVTRRLEAELADRLAAGEFCGHPPAKRKPLPPPPKTRASVPDRAWETAELGLDFEVPPAAVVRR